MKKIVSIVLALDMVLALSEIKPETPYTSADLNYNDSSTRATKEQRDDTARPAAAS